jgi:parallel beta-helix repeat protein
MKKQIFLLAILLICLSTIRTKTASSQEGTLQNLIDTASQGDTVYLPAGVYYEHLQVNKPLTIIGAPTTIDGNGSGLCLGTVTPFYINGSRYGRCFNVVVKNVVVQNALNGFYLELCSDCVIENCTIQNMSYGIQMDDARNNTILENRFYNNHLTIHYYGEGNTFKGNIFKNNLQAIYMQASYDRFEQNLFVENYIGIDVACYSYYNTFYGNTFINSTRANMQIWLSRSNLIYYNNFFKGMGEQVIFVGASSTNFWSNGTHGNYWSDYNGTDLFSGINQTELGSDGIGDTPYIMTENNIDSYPLMTDPAPNTPRVKPERPPIDKPYTRDRIEYGIFESKNQPV